MDDTVFDHTLTARAAISRIRRRTAFLRAASLDELCAFYGRALRETHSHVTGGRMTGVEARDERWHRMVTRFGGGGSRTLARRLSREYRREYLTLQRAVPGAVDLLRRLHRHRTVVIVTNHVAAEQERKLRFLGVREAVDYLVASGEVGASKPDPRIFRAALRRAGSRPEETVMIGDSWHEDIVGALRSGIRPLWFNRFHLPRPSGPVVGEIDSLRPASRVERWLSARASSPATPTRIISRGPVQSR